MKKQKTALILMLIFGMNYSCNANENKLTTEQEKKFNTDIAAFTLSQMVKQEKKMAALPQKEIVVFTAAGGINRLAIIKKESGNFDSGEFYFILSVMLYRLSILSQAANMPPAITACHLAEARNLENISQGKSPIFPNCRTKSYKPDIQSDALIEESKPSWDATNDLISKWVTSNFSYAQSLWKIMPHGNSPTSKTSLQ